MKKIVQCLFCTAKDIKPLVASKRSIYKCQCGASYKINHIFDEPFLAVAHKGEEYLQDLKVKKNADSYALLLDTDKKLRV